VTGARTVVGKLGPMVYLPTILFSLGDGALIPLVPAVASSLGAGLGLGALIVSLRVVGQLCGNLPAGWMVARVGERTTMVVAAAVSILVLLVVLIAPSPAVLAAVVFLIGICAAVFGLARHALITTRVPAAFRARALSILGGSARLGTFLGPLIATVLLQWFSALVAPVGFFLVCLAVLIVLVIFGRDPEKMPQPPAHDTTGTLKDEPAGMFATMWTHRRVLLRLGVAASAMSASRSARQVILPLWGLSLGLDAATIALVVGVSGAIDFALFYASGQIMDRYGPRWAAVPSMLVTGAGFVVLAFTHDLHGAVAWYIALALALGAGNAPSSVVLLAVGSDAAPQSEPAAFLGAWRTLMDAAAAAAPLLVTAMTAAVSVSLASGFIGALALLGAAGFHRWLRT
jgi:MFS family permease